MATPEIQFELPLSEHIRICLRLEHLFQKAHDNIMHDSTWQHRASLSAVLEILNVIDRPDLKAKLTKALLLRAGKLAQWEDSAQVDQLALKQIMNKLDSLLDALHSNRARLGQNLRDNEFLRTIRQHAPSPGGACAYNTPAYHLWLQQPLARRQFDLSNWLSEFDQLKEIVTTLLSLTRSTSDPETILAENGAFQRTLDSKKPCELIRITMQHDTHCYPEISAGRHHLSVRFLEHDIHHKERGQQVASDIPFKLYCYTL